MNNIIEKLKRYIKKSLGIEIELEIWKDSNRLPFFLRDTYWFYKTNLCDCPCLLFLAQSDEEQTPAVISKHVLALQEKWNGGIIYIHEAISSYNRERLIAQKVSFIVPENQMYLPPLGIDLREYFKKIHTSKNLFSPSTQAVVIHALLQKERSTYSQSVLARTLGYTHMTMNRAFKEIDLAGLGSIFSKGREKILQFEISKIDLWEKAKEYFRNPIKRKVFIYPIENNPYMVSAGLTALAHYSMLAPPAHQIFATNPLYFGLIKTQQRLVEHTIFDIKETEVELWSYSPELFAQNGVVDPFSLYCSLKYDTDERIESALDEMMRNIEW